MVIFDCLKKKLRKSKETETGEKTKDALTTSPEKANIMESNVKDPSTHKWQDETSRKVEERLMEKGIRIPWHYNDTFGDSKVLALRAGGVGAVFFVKSTLFGERIYAAKTLQRFLQRDYFEMPTYQQKKIADDFLEEALPWLKMGQHPNIVPVHLLENIVHPTTRRNVPFVFSEFMEGGDLRNLLVEKGRFELEEALSVGLQVCEALIHAYTHGLSAHKDLKPEGIIGTPGYMAPEQVASHFELKDNIAIDQRADQFAIGLIMPELLSGKHPFPWIIRAAYSKEEAEKFLRGGTGEIPDNLSVLLRGIIARCLSSDPDNRFSGLSALKEALLEVYRTEFGRDFRFPEVEIDNSPVWWFDRGRAFSNIGRDAGAEVSYKEALKMSKAIPGMEFFQWGCLMNLGNVYERLGKFYEAADYLKEALRMLKAIPGTEIHQGRCLKSLGFVYLDIGKFYEAADYLKEALRMLKAIPGTEISQVGCLMEMGNVYFSTGKFYKARVNYKEALRMYKAIPGTEIDQAYCIRNLGIVYLSTGKFYEAEGNLKEALRMLKAISGTEISQAGCLMERGNVYFSTGKFYEAEGNYKEALRTYKVIPGTEIRQAYCIRNLGVVYLSTGKFYEAADNLKEALRMYKAIPGTEIDQARCIMNLGIVYESTGKFYEAEGNYKEALRMYKAIPGTEIHQVKCLINIGNVYRKIGRFSEVEDNLKEALRMCKAIPGTEIDQAKCLANLGIFYSTIQEFNKARSVLKEALEICEQYPMGTEETKKTCLQLLSQIP
jgi:tetratricopeptide (TPR) repeat protein